MVQYLDVLHSVFGSPETRSLDNETEALVLCTVADLCERDIVASLKSEISIFKFSILVVIAHFKLYLPYLKAAIQLVVVVEAALVMVATAAVAVVVLEALLRIQLCPQGLAH